MTLREALLKGIKIWEWLAENPSAGKDSAYRALGLARDMNLCPMCEYASWGWGGDDFLCDNCPVWDVTLRCDGPGQPYSRWTDIPSGNFFPQTDVVLKVRSIAAREVADQIREKLNEP